MEFIIELFVIIHLLSLLNKITDTTEYDLNFILNFLLFLFLYGVHCMRFFISIVELLVR